MFNKQSFRGNGKLLLTGEYFVLDGVPGIALPTKFGQSLTIMDNFMSDLQMTSFDKHHEPWFTGSYTLPDLMKMTSSSDKIGHRFYQILKAARELNPNFLNNFEGKIAVTHLDFPRNWGLGTSSTLIYTMAKWAEVDPFDLLKKTFGGSGYDIACASADGPIIYAKKEDGQHFNPCKFSPSFKNNLYFVFLEKKQNSREGIARYKEKVTPDSPLIDDMIGLSYAMGSADDLADFEECIVKHEKLIAKTLELERAKDLYFKDYWGEVKSLGAWGGDFVLVTSEESEEKTRAYFLEKGFPVFLKYEEMILERD